MKKILLILLCISFFFLGACSSTTVSAEQNQPLKIWFQNSNGAFHTLCVVDDETKVNYVVVSTERGNGEYSIAITPRLNPDGSLYTGE